MTEAEPKELAARALEIIARADAVMKSAKESDREQALKTLVRIAHELYLFRVHEFPMSLVLDIHEFVWLQDELEARTEAVQKQWGALSMTASGTTHRNIVPVADRGPPPSETCSAAPFPAARAAPAALRNGTAGPVSGRASDCVAAAGHSQPTRRLGGDAAS
ncbi:MAG: hypothetical protein ABSC94_01960 [Polyangiaceae bacterium]|jgi:hypothetical protein